MESIEEGASSDLELRDQVSVVKDTAVRDVLDTLVKRLVGCNP